MTRQLRVAALAVGLHAAASAAHGVPHAAVPVPLAPWQWAFVYGVIVLAPLVALGLLRRGKVEVGGTLLAVSMAASLLFGVYFHFVAPTPDHVGAVPAGPWRGPFRVTALVAAIVDAVGVFVGVRLMDGRWRSDTAAEA